MRTSFRIFSPTHRLRCTIFFIFIFTGIYFTTSLLMKFTHDSCSSMYKILPFQKIIISENKTRPPNVTIAEKDIHKYLVPYRSDDENMPNMCSIDIIEGAPPISFHHAKKQQVGINWPKFSESFAKRLSISEGGEWQPDHCISRFLVAIIVPVKNREDNLKEFLLNMHPFLQKQNIHYRIYVMELPSNVRWNKGILFNAGYYEVMKDKLYPCLILNDVDLLPMYRNNIYACTTGFRQMVVYHYEGVRKQIADWNGFAWEGGATAILSDHYKLANGFSNRFFDWGREDEDFLLRAENQKIQIMRYAQKISQYQEMSHKLSKRNKANNDVFLQGSRYYHEGLNTTKYNVIRRINEPLCTRIIISY